MTETGSIMGTAQYLSPEQAQGHAVSAQSDLYAIGIVLYEMLTGTVPFDGDSAVTIALKQVSEPPLPPSRLNPAVAAGLEAVVLRALAKEPAQRFADADEFIAALEDGARGHGRAGRRGDDRVHAGGRRRRRGGGRLRRAARRGPRAALVAVGPARRRCSSRARSPRRCCSPARTRRPCRASSAPTSATAARTLRNDGFKPVVERVRNDAAEGHGHRARTPNPGEELEEGEEVTLTVSDGPGLKGVPDVDGPDAEAGARRGSTTRASRCASARRPRDDVAEGTRHRDRARRRHAGRGRQHGDDRRLDRARAGRRARRRRQSSLDEARGELEGAGLEVDVAARGDRATPSPTPCSARTRRGGTEVDEGSTVTLTVAEEAEQVDGARASSGLDESAAAERLSGAGLEVDVRGGAGRHAERRRQGARPVAGPGREVERGRRVTITVGRFDPDLDPDPGDTTEEPPPGGRRATSAARPTARARAGRRGEGRRPRRRALLRARRVARLGRVGARGPRRRPATRSSPSSSHRDGTWTHDGEEVALRAGRRPARLRRRLPGPARPVRRGRHGPGPARAARRARTSARASRPARCAWTSCCSRTSWPRAPACRRSASSAAAPPDAARASAGRAGSSPRGSARRSAS